MTKVSLPFSSLQWAESDHISGEEITIILPPKYPLCSKLEVFAGERAEESNDGFEEMKLLARARTSWHRKRKPVGTTDSSLKRQRQEKQPEQVLLPSVMAFMSNDPFLQEQSHLMSSDILSHPPTALAPLDLEAGSRVPSSASACSTGPDTNCFWTYDLDKIYGLVHRVHKDTLDSVLTRYRAAKGPEEGVPQWWPSEVKYSDSQSAPG